MPVGHKIDNIVERQWQRRGGGLCPLAQNVLSGRYDMIMLSREYADSTHTHTHILGKKPASRRREEGKARRQYIYM